MVGVVERLAGDLLRREHGQVGHLPADLLERALRLALDVLARGGDQLLPLGLALGRSLGDGGVGGLARSGHDVLSLLARLLEALAVLGEDRVGLLALLLRGLDVLPDRVGALLEEVPDLREREPLERVQHDEEQDQGPDHQTQPRRDQEAAAAFLLGGGERQYRRDCGEQLHLEA